MTLAQIRSEVAALLSLDLTNSEELELLDQWINEGVSYVLAHGETKVSKDDAVTTAGEGDYDLDLALLRILWIQAAANGANAELQQVGPTEILRRRLNGSSSSPAQLYAVDGSNALMLYPVPDGVQTLTIYFVPRPELLLLAADEPDEVPQEFHRLIVFYALWRGADYDDDQTSAQGARYKQLLDEGVSDMKSRLNRKRGRRLARVVPARGRRVAHRNDVYPN